MTLREMLSRWHPLWSSKGEKGESTRALGKSVKGRKSYFKVPSTLNLALSDTAWFFAAFSHNKMNLRWILKTENDSKTTYSNLPS